MTNKTKVGFIGHRTENPANNGIDYHVSNIIRRLPIGEYEIHSYCHSSAIELDSVRVFHKCILPEFSIFRPFNAVLGSIFLRFSGVKQIHFHGLNSALFLPVVALFVPKIIFTLHSDDWNYPKWGPFAKLILKISFYLMRFSADRVIHVSPYYRKIYGKREDILIYTGVFDDAPPQPMKDGFEVVSDEIVVVGRITPEKRQLEIAKAFAESEAKVNFFGACHDDAYSRLFKEEVQRCENLVFHGMVNNDTLRRILSRNYYLNFSSFEGLSIANVEGVVLSKGFILSDIPANFAIADLGEGAFVEEIEALRVRVEACEWYELTEEKRQELLRKFSWEHCIEEIRKVYA